jgi:hypothetical protein
MANKKANADWEGVVLGALIFGCIMLMSVAPLLAEALSKAGGF